MTAKANFADLILSAHVAFIAFVVVGQLLIMLGAWRGWRWILNFRFRICHVLAIVFVTLQAWVGAWCPLTLWEDALRRSDGQDGYSSGFIAHYVHQLIYFELPLWVFTIAYTAFAGLVMVFWFVARPR
ncbi:MAG TPA: DUF2784 domain-containing protein [Kiritimatiellia bacterium]|nr:DUF2784 domain-containing protein [Kiritimatiellia bacterium]